MFYTKSQYTLRVRDVDFRERIRPAAILDLFQDIAGVDIPLSRAELLKRGQFWLLTRISARILNLPERGDTVNVFTRRGARGMAYADREFLIKGENGEPLIEGNSRWCLMDAESLKLLKITDCAYRLDESSLPRLTQILPEKAQGIGGCAEKRITFPVAISDLDANRHVNNARYGDYILNAFSLAELANNEIASLTLNYIKELRHGQTVSVWREHLGGEEYGLEARGDDGTVYLTAKLSFK